MTRPNDPARACRGMDPNFFFPAAGGGQMARERAAKAVCARCPVKRDCLAWAIGNLSDGVAGGMTPDERDRAATRSRRLRIDYPGTGMPSNSVGDFE